MDKECVWRLEKYSRPIARIRVAALGAAVRQMPQQVNAPIDNLVRLAALYIGDDTHSAGVVLELGAVQSSRHVFFHQSVPQSTGR